MAEKDKKDYAGHTNAEPKPGAPPKASVGGVATALKPGVHDEPNPEPEPVVPKGPVVTLYGTVDHGDLVMVHGDVGRERRVMAMHRQEFLRHGDDLQARQLWVAGLLASAPQTEPQITDPWEIKGKVKLLEPPPEASPKER